MGIVLQFHAGTSFGYRSGRRKESIGKPVSSLSRLASSRDTPFLPARILRRWEIEQPTRPARAAAASSSAMKGASGCVSDMATYISIRNAKSQPQKFLPEMVSAHKVITRQRRARRSCARKNTPKSRPRANSHHKPLPSLHISNRNYLVDIRTFLIETRLIKQGARHDQL